MRRPIAFVFYLIVLLLTAACSTTGYTKVQSEQLNPKFRGGRANKVLVVMFTQDPALREDVETQFAMSSVARDLDTVEVSHRVTPKIEDMTRERLEDLVRTNSYDRVVIIRMVPGKVTAGVNTRYGDYYSILPSTMFEYWEATMAVTFSPTDPPPTMGVYMTIPVEVTMFDAKDASAIWISQYRVTTSEYRIEATKSFVKTVLSQLQRAGLI